MTHRALRVAGDAALVALLAVPWLVLVPPGGAQQVTAIGPAAPAVLGATVVVEQLPVLLRRRAPWTAVLLGALACLPVLALGGPVNGLGLAVLVHGAVHRGRGRGGAGTAMAHAAGGTALLVVFTAAAGLVVRGPLVEPVLAVLVGAVTGALRQAVRRHRDGLRDRSEAAALAATLAADRHRIGAELHEVVRARLVAIVAGAERSERAGRGGDGPVAALGCVERDARAALAALRRMLTLLRDGADAPAVAPDDGRGTAVRRLRWPDVALTGAFAAAVGLVGLIPFAGSPAFLGLPTTALGWAAAIVAIGALLLRTAAPSLGYLLHTATVLAWAVPGAGALLVCSVAGFVLVVAALARDALRRSVPVFVLGAVVGMVSLVVLGLGPAPLATVLSGVLGTLLLLGWGLWLRARRLRDARERSDRAALSRREQRLRIARDLHDVVAHHVSGMVVQAGTAHALAGDRPDLVDTALAHARDAGRRTLAAMPGLLDALDPAADPVPTLTAADVARLAGPLRAAGATVRVRVDGDRVVDGPAAREARQIIREALTNVLRHAGPSATEVRVALRPDGVEVAVTDAGPVPGHRAEPGGGFGLVGARERVARLGGLLDAGPSGDGWRVRALLPPAPALVASQVDPSR